MEIAKVIINLLVGLVVFVTGMSMMSNGLKVTAGRQIRRLFKKIKDNKMASVAIGAGTTAIIQSSGATTVMVVGFLSAGALTFIQGFSVMLGAFLGTTVTGLLVSLSSFSFSMFLMAIAFIGFILGFINNATAKSIGEILIGFGILFFGLEAMKSAFSNEQIQTFLVNLLSSINFPILLMLMGILLTAITQSSSATNGIVIIMVASSPSLLSTGFYLIIGASVGALMPTILAAIKSNILAKRVTYSTLIIRFIFALLFTAIIWIFETPLMEFLVGNFKTESVGLILAIFYVIFNLLYIIVNLPIASSVEKLANKLFKDRSEKKKKLALRFINDNLLNTPAVAIIQVKREIEEMLNMARSNFTIGVDSIFTHDLSKANEVAIREDNIDYINNAISEYLIKLSAKAGLRDEAKIGSYYHVINDIERIGDHAYNFMEMAKKLDMEELNFSDTAKKEFDNYIAIINQMFDLSDKIFMDRKKSDLAKLHALEDQTDKLSIEYQNAHFQRIKNNECKNELSPFHQQLLTELERVADHLTNVGYSIVNPVGDDVGHNMKNI